MSVWLLSVSVSVSVSEFGPARGDLGQLYQFPSSILFPSIFFKPKIVRHRLNHVYIFKNEIFLILKEKVFSFEKKMCLNMYKKFIFKNKKLFALKNNIRNIIL